MASAPMENLKEVVHALEQAGADILHFDIEDGSFVPEIRLGLKIISDLRPLTKLPFDIHLMVNNPEWLIPRLAAAGAERVSVHFEACPYPRRTLGLISKAGMQAGLAFNPKTPLPELQQYLPFLRFVSILTTEPEEGDCAYLPSVLQKVTDGKSQSGGAQFEWEVDGGFHVNNIHEAVEAGADIVVAGRGVFCGEDLQKTIQAMKKSGN